MGIAGLLGALAFWRRRRKSAEPPAVDAGPDPAEELRARLAENRASGDAVEDEEPVTGADAEASPLDPETRRRSVHDRARASIDELK